MKKISKLILTLVFCLILIGCNANHNHIFSEWEEMVSPTCTTKGIDKRICTSCGYYETKDVDPTGHTYGEWQVIIEATEGSAGIKEKVCTKCNDRQTEVISQLDHTHKYTEKIIEPTCTEKGHTQYTCDCGDSYQENEKAALGHSYGEWIIVTPAEENKKGLKEKVCTKCNDKITEEIPELSHIHSYTNEVVKPTCTEKGYTLYTCKCGDTYKDNYTEKTDHVLGEWKIVDNPTCITKGIEKRICINCTYYETREVEPTGHTYGEWIIVTPAEENKKGLKEKVCTKCNDKITEEIPELDHVHNYTNKVVAPTCTEKGYTEYTCKCGDTYKDNYTEKTDHVLGEWKTVDNPTCTEKGMKKRVCVNCTYYETKEMGPTGHAYGEWKTIDNPTCTKKGIEKRICINCTYYETKEIDATGHTYGEWKTVDNPTCTKKGTEKRICINCTYFEKKEIDATGHNYTKDVISPTCTAKGYTLYTCKCGDTYKDNYIDALGHSYGEWIIITPAEVNKTGLKERTCAKCNDKQTEIIPIIIDEKSTYNIRWYWDNNCIYTSTYDTEKGLLPEEMYDFEEEGYTLEGWYTTSECLNGGKVDEIEVGKKGNINLYAKMKLIEYEIHYYNAYSHNNQLKYTIVDEVILEKASYSGLVFSRWIDENGENVEKINKGTTGDIDLYACYYMQESIVDNTESGALEVVYDEESNAYFFLYSLGKIRNVVLSEIDAFDKTTNDHSREWKKSYEQEYTESVAENVANTVTKVVTNTSSWEESIAKAKSKSSGWEVGGELNFKNILKVNGKYAQTTTKTKTKTNSSGGSSSEQQGEEETFSSTVAYDNAYKETVTTTDKLSENAPNGKYKYVTTGTVSTYMLIVYDVKSGNYYMSAYSILDSSVSTTILYEPEYKTSDSNAKPVDGIINIDQKDPISYKIPFETLEKYVKNSYLVKYDANGGTGEMETSVYLKDTKYRLSKNTFTREGFKFIGWSTTAEGDVMYDNNTEVKNLTSEDKITLYAQWLQTSIGTLTINFNPGDGSGSMVSQIIEYKETKKLNKNNFSREGYTFLGWAESSDGEVIYSDEQEIYFDGIYPKEITLYARWERNIYSIIISELSIEVPSAIKPGIPEIKRVEIKRYDYAYGETINKEDIKAPKKNGYIFYSFAGEIPDKMPSNDVDILASYLNSSQAFTRTEEEKITDSGREKQPYDKITITNLDKYQELGYTKIKVSISIDISEKNDGYQHIFLYNNLDNLQNPFVNELYVLKDVNGNECKVKYDHGGDGVTTTYKTYNFETTISIANIISFNDSTSSTDYNLYVSYGASGEDEDTWYNKNLKVKITFEK